MPPLSSKNSNNLDYTEASEIIKGRPKKVLGLVKRENGEYLVQVEWTTGKSYIPHSLMKKYFTDLWVDYLVSRVEFMEF